MSNQGMTSGRILVIDDNLEIHSVFRKVLENEAEDRSSHDRAADNLFRRSAKAKTTPSFRLDFASQGEEGHKCVKFALETGDPYAMAFVDMRMPPGWDGLQTIAELWKIQPGLLMVLCTAFSDYSWEEICERLGINDRLLILKKPFDNVEVRQFANALCARADTERTLIHVQQQLMEAAKEAGMAEVATGVLHNVGNVLNSINVAATVVVDQLRRSKTSSLVKAVRMLAEQEASVAEFLTNDPKGKQLPSFLKAVSEELVREQEALIQEALGLQRNVGHVKEVISMQQSFAKLSGSRENLAIQDLVEDALRISTTAMIRHQIEIVREFDSVPPALVDRHKVLQILINLINNAKHALDERPQGRQLKLRVLQKGGRVRVEVVDNGMGIPPENLTRIFDHGFTTKKTGHGFGLHSGARAASEMGGSLTVWSAGTGTGATFVLEVPSADDPAVGRAA